MIHAFIYGFVLAFGLIIPLGVQNVFVFNQGATQTHFLYALPSVLTAAICDTILITIAVLGVSVAVLTIPWLKIVIFVIGFFFLMYMGYVTWNNSSAKLNENHEPLSSKKQIAFAASVSLLNPHALLDTIGVIGTNALHFVGTARLVYTLACVLVSWSWFFGLAVAGYFMHRLDETGLGLTLVNKISACIIWAVGLYIGWQLSLFLM